MFPAVSGTAVVDLSFFLFFLSWSVFIFHYTCLSPLREVSTCAVTLCCTQSSLGPSWAPWQAPWGLEEERYLFTPSDSVFPSGSLGSFPQGRVSFVLTSAEEGAWGATGCHPGARGEGRSQRSVCPHPIPGHLSAVCLLPTPWGLSLTFHRTPQAAWRPRDTEPAFSRPSSQPNTQITDLSLKERQAALERLHTSSDEFLWTRPCSSPPDTPAGEKMPEASGVLPRQSCFIVLFALCLFFFVSVLTSLLLFSAGLEHP